MSPSQHDAFNQDLFSFISRNPTPYHTVATIRNRLLEAGYSEYDETLSGLQPTGCKGFVVRDGSLIAFSLNGLPISGSGLRIIGCHTDSPSLQIKPRLKKSRSPYLVAGIEVYGGAKLSSWFDRELSLAGRISCRTGDGDIGLFLIDFKRPVVCLPSLAIHLDRTANEGKPVNAHTDLGPIIGLDTSGKQDMLALLQQHVNHHRPDNRVITSILGFDLFCYDPFPPRYCGMGNEFIIGPRLDNQLSCFVGIEALCHHDSGTNCLLLCMNHEEIGSRTKSGALGNFADLVLSRLLPQAAERDVCLNNSFLLSLDNAHASHPNFRDKSDEDHEILLNHGPVIKLNATQRYATTARTSAIFKLIAEEAGVSTQEFVMRSDAACGSTIGPLTSARLGVDAIDIGAPTWGMHSIRETTGSADPLLLLQVVQHFANRRILPNVVEYR